MSAIRMARQRDAARIGAMSRELIESGLGWSWTPARVSRSIADRDTNVIVADVDGVLSGFALMKYLEEDAHLLLFAVAPQQRRRGIGRAMWDWLLQTCEIGGIASVQLEVRARNTGARDFYRRLGFTDAGTVRGYYRGVEAALRMCHSIRSSLRSDPA